MSLAGVVGLFRGKPKHAVSADGRMALADHFRELRARLMRSLLVFVLLFFGALFFYNELLDLILEPYNHAREVLKADVSTEAYVKGATGPLMLQLKLCGIAALVLASPYWLYQIWGFLVPGLTRREKRWSRVFAAVAGPLFLGGVALGYYVLPKGLEVLIGFTPDGMQNLVEFGEYFSFFTRMLLVFGIAMQIPLFVIMLNLAGIITGKQIGAYRPWIIVGTFIFAAVATPSTDPFAMSILAGVMTALFLISEVVARLLDQWRGRRAAGTDQWADDEISAL